MPISHTKQLSKPTTRQGQIEYILDQLSPEEIREFILTKALQDTDFRDTLLITFSELLSSDEPAEPKYAQMLDDIAKRYADAEGYIHANSTFQLINSLQQLLETARKATTPARETIDLCLALITRLPHLGENMEDPHDGLYNLMRSACTILWECYSVLSPEQQQNLFERIASEYAKPIYVDLDLDSALLALLKDWARHDKKRQALCLRQQENLLKNTDDDNWRKNYLLEQTNELIAFWRTDKT